VLFVSTHSDDGVLVEFKSRSADKKITARRPCLNL
jgi:hypothetical protein